MHMNTKYLRLIATLALAATLSPLAACGKKKESTVDRIEVTERYRFVGSPKMFPKCGDVLWEATLFGANEHDSWDDYFVRVWVSACRADGTLYVTVDQRVTVTDGNLTSATYEVPVGKEGSQIAVRPIHAENSQCVVWSLFNSSEGTFKVLEMVRGR
jgi:hypothetical protein